jgi:non-ribosomal peptide synthetase component E (peptide arylation enzyme)
VSIRGRKKEIIIRGGINIAPREIEDILIEMPGVRAAAVVGIPDSRLGEIVCACVEPLNEPGIALPDMIEFLHQRHIAAYKIPQRLVNVKALPRTASGKVQKPLLIEMVLRSASDGVVEY